MRGMHKRTVLGLEVPHGPNGVSVVALLQAIQEKYNYLPEELLKQVSQEMEIPLIDIYSVATFYKAFSLIPKGKHQIVTCLGTACHVRGSEKVTEEICRVLNIKRDSTSKDGMYSLECVNCLGACALAPLVIMDGKYYGHMTPLKVRQLFSGLFDAETSQEIGGRFKESVSSGHK